MMEGESGDCGDGDGVFFAFFTLLGSRETSFLLWACVWSVVVPLSSVAPSPRVGDGLAAVDVSDMGLSWVGSVGGSICGSIV